MREVLFKVVTNLGFKGLSVVLVLAMQVMLARWLTPVEYGQFALLQVIAVGFATFAQAGMQNAYMKLIAQLDDLFGVLQVTLVCIRLVFRNLWIALFGFLIMTIILYQLKKIESVNVIILFAYYISFQALMMMLLAWYRGVNKAYISSLLEQGSYSGLTVAFGFCWLLVYQEKLHLEAAVSAFSVSVSVIFVLALIPVILKLIEHKNDVYSADIMRIKQLSRRFLIMDVATYLTNWGGVIAVGFILATEQVAELSVAQCLSQIIIFFLIAFNGVVGPRFARLSAQNDWESVRKLAQYTSCIMTLITLPVAGIVIAFGSQLLGVFGDKYVDAYPLLLVLLVGQVVNSLTGSVGFLLNMTNHEKIVRNIVVVSSVVTLLVSIVATWQFGVIGAAISITLGVALNNLTMVFFVYKYLGFVTIPGLQWIGRQGWVSQSR